MTPGFAQQFTAKLRDYESGLNLDYFGARYYAGALGRFTSPDAPFIDQTRLDPQSWNLYGYVRNNPLRYIDPDGQKIELLGDEEERKRALAELQRSVGEEAGQRLQEVQDGERYFVGIIGEAADFTALGDAASDLGDLIGADPVVEFGVTDQALPGRGKDEAAYTYAPGEIGNENVRVLVNPAKVSATNRFFRTPFGQMRFGSGTVRSMTMPVAIWHEFGHAWRMWQSARAKSFGVIPGASESTFRVHRA